MDAHYHYTKPQWAGPCCLVTACNPWVAAPVYASSAYSLRGEDISNGTKMSRAAVGGRRRVTV